MDLHLDGDVALVTASSSGLGFASAQSLAREDALEANERYWVMRTGRFVPSEYDHPMTGEWRDDEL